MHGPGDTHPSSHQPATEHVERESPLTTKALVTGINGPAGSATVAFLRLRGLCVVWTDICPAESIVDSFFLVPRGDDPCFEDAILAVVSGERPVLLVPTVSEELAVVSRFKHRLRALGVHLFISEPGVVDLANDKLDTATQLHELRIPVPRTLLLSEMQGVMEAGERLLMTTLEGD